MNDNINATKNITQDAATAMIQSMTVEQLQVFMQMISQAIMAQQAPQTGAVEPVVNPEPVPKQMSPEEEMEEFVNRTGSEMLDIDMQKTKFEKVRLMDFSEIKTREDIMNDFLYDAIYSDDVRESDLIKIVSELKVIAKKIGGRELESDVKEICRVRKKDLQRKIKKKHEAKNKKQKDEDYKSFEESYSTEFSDLPEFSTGNRVCGFRFKADDSGIYEIDDSGDINSIGYKILCRTPVLINRVILPDEGYYDGAEKKFEIIYRDNHGWHKKILAQDVLFNSSKIDILIKDIGFEKEISKKLSAYFIDTYELSIRSGKLPEVTAFSKFGFSHDMQRFYPYVDEPLMDSESEFKKLVKALQPHGDENLWFEAMRKMRATKIHMLNFAIAGALSAPLIGLLKMEGFTCNIYGNKGTGKSVSCKIAATIFGDCNQTSGYITSLKQTVTSSEVKMNVLNNIPVFFEDYNNQSERQKQGFYELIMGVANGCGTQRSNKNLSLREQFTWSLAAVMNSEKRISPTFQTGGARARVLECKAEAAFPWRDEDDVPMAGEIMNFFSCNYGHGGRRYTDILLEIGEEKIREIFTKFLRKLQMSSSKAKFADKQATNAAIFMTADYIAAKYLFQDGIMFTVDEVLDFMTDETEADPNSQFYDYIMEQFHRNEANFEGTLLYKRMSFHTQFWGIYQSESQKDGQLVEYVCILRSCLDDMAKNQDVDLTMFFDWLRQKNLLNADNGRNTRCITRRDSATRVRLVKIRMPQEKEEIETEDENEFASIEVLQPISDDDEFVSDEEWPFPDENSPVQQEEKIISDNSSDENIAQEYMQFDIADADPMHVCG